MIGADETTEQNPSPENALDRDDGGNLPHPKPFSEDNHGLWASRDYEEAKPCVKCEWG